MIRPMTSDVSALSGGVAKSHQAIHFVSSAPSKIPYGGFSPVRLQASLPDVTFRDAPAPRYRHPPSRQAFTHLLFGSLGLRPIRTCRTPTQTHSPSGPWLRQWLCCPPASSLTMATSELLHRTAGFLYCRRLSRPRRSPLLSLRA